VPPRQQLQVSQTGRQIEVKQHESTQAHNTDAPSVCVKKTSPTAGGDGEKKVPPIDIDDAVHEFRHKATSLLEGKVDSPGQVYLVPWAKEAWGRPLPQRGRLSGARTRNLRKSWGKGKQRGQAFSTRP